MELNHAENRDVSTADKQCGGGGNNYLQLLYIEVREILFYQGFPRLILPTKHQERSEGCLVGKIGRRNSWLSKSSCTQF